MNKFLTAAAFAVGTMTAGMAAASPIPGITDPYQGNYDLGDAFSSHGLWLPHLLGDHTWSINAGSTANLNGTYLDMTGTATQTVNGTDYTVAFDFSVIETTDAPNGLICGSGQACNGATQEMRDNIMFFDMGSASTMGTITGLGALAGLSLDVIMRPLGGTGRKPGQLGYGGNWTTLDFGYSNWMWFDVTSEADNAVAGLSATLGQRRGGDINLDFLANSTPGPLPVPLPAGLPLLLAGMGALYGLRRRKG